MLSFDFITDEELRTSLNSDYQELLTCFEGKAWKGVHVFAGSIVEAVLIELIISEHLTTREQALRMDLGGAVSLCLEKKIISSRTSDLSTVVRGYRNLIHPGRQVRLKDETDESSAQVAKALVNIVVGEVEKRKKENYGYTAEQIVSKLRRDSYADTIISHLIAHANPIEQERLVLHVLPSAYMQELEADYSPEYVLPVFRSSFRMAFDQAAAEVKVKAVKKFAKILKEESDTMVL